MVDVECMITSTWAGGEIWRPMCFLQTRIESYAANAVIDTIISAGIVIALCATDLKLLVWMRRMIGR
jgi:hypothetical protein